MGVEEFVYAHRATGPLKLRVFRPTGPARLATAVLHLHGGAWRVGTPAMLDSRSAAYAARGYTVIQVQYRLLGQAPWPAPVTDVRSALRWVTGHAGELGLRPDSFVLWGHSAGGTDRADDGCNPRRQHPQPPRRRYECDGFRCRGHRLLCAGEFPCVGRLAAPDRARGIDLAAILANQQSDGALPAVDLLESACTQAQADAISPLALVGPDFPPTMIVHGTADVLIRPINSRRLADELARLGVVAELVEFAECNHEFDAAPSYGAAVVAHIDVFLRRVLHEPTLAAEMQQYSMFR